MKNIYQVLFLLLFALSVSNAQTNFTGVTVITHGFQAFGSARSDAPNWAIEQARAILKRNGGGFIYKSNPVTGTWEVVEYYGSTTASRTHIVLIYNWVFSSWQFEDGNLEAAADNLFGMLMACPLIPKDIFWGNSVHKHFIGHSRGAVLLLQLFHRVLKANPVWKIDHFTSLDPHPATFMKDQFLPYVSPDGDRYKLQIPENVIKADNYYRTDNAYEIGKDFFAFDGVPVIGAKSIKLNNNKLNSPLSIIGGAHSNVHMWYFGTIDVNNNTYDGKVLPGNQWYGGIGDWYDLNGFGTGGASRNELGFQYSKVGGWYNQWSDVTNKVDWPSKPPRIFNGDFRYIGQNSLTQGIFNFTAGWQLNGGQSHGVTFNSAGASILTNVKSDLRHSILLIPTLTKSLKFKARYNSSVLGTNASLQVKFYDIYGNSFKLANCNLSTTNAGGKFVFTNPNVFELVEVCIPTELKGKSGTFSITTEDNTFRTITVDDFAFVDNNGANLRDSAEKGLQNTTVASSYMDFPVSYSVNPNPLITGSQPTSFNATITNSLSSPWSGTLAMTWRNVNDSGRGIPLATQNVTLSPNATVTLDRGIQQIISTAGEYVLSIYANDDTSPIDRYYYYVNDAPVIPATVVNIETPSSVSFGSVNVGGSFDKTITIKNASTSNSILTGNIAPIGGADMSIISGSQTLNLAPNQSQNITVRFSPQSGGVYNNSLNINGNFNGASKSINLTGTGVTVVPTLTYSRAPGQTYNLLDAPMGNFSEGIITVSNNSSAAFSGSFAVSGSGYSGFVAGGGSNLSIPSGGSKNITVRFTPTANGASTGSLNITGSATNTPATFNFSALGTGFPTSGCVTSNIAIKTSVVDISYTGWREFGRFTLTNTSNTLPANITNFKIGGADNPRFRVIGYQNTTFSLNAGESREFVVDINPITTQGTYSGVMIVGSGPIGAGCNLNIDLRGTPASTNIDPPLLIDPVADYVIPFTGVNYGMSLFYRKNNVNGLANYKVYLKDLTTDQVLFDYYNEGTLPTRSPTAQNVFQTFNYGNVVSATGHQYAWKIRAESVNDPNVYTDSELRFFSALQPSICTAPTDFSITDISKNSASITWNAVPNAFSYNIETSSDGGQTYIGTQYNLTTPQSTISNLTNSTLYKVRLISNCGQGNYNINQYTRSQPSIDKAFTTLGDCSTLTSTISPNTAQVICQGTSVNLTSSAGSSYKWYKDNNLITGATSQVYSAGQAGTYKAKVLNANGCEVFSNEVSVSEITKPSVSISSNSNGICPNSSVVLSTTQISGMTYQWIKDGTNIPNATSSSYTAVASGVYQLSYTQNGCAFTTDLFNLSALPEPVIYVTGNNNLTVGSTMNLSAFGADTYSWTGPNFTSAADQVAIPNMQMANAGNYTVIGTGTNGCISNVNFAVTVSPQPPSVTSATINSGQTATLTASGCSGTVYWYGYPSEGDAFREGAIMTTPILGATTTYYASCVVGEYMSTTRGSGTVTVNPASSCSIPTGMQWSDTTPTSFRPRCNNLVGYSYVFRYRVSGTTTWTETAPVTDPVNSTVGTMFTGLTSGTSYEWQVKTVCGSGSESAYSASTYSSTSGCTPPQPPTVSSVIITSGQTATLTASGCGGTVNWYGAANGGSSLATGTSFTTPTLTATTTYYASCVVGECTSTTRGSGTVTVNPALSCPVPTGMQWSNTTATSFLPRCTNIVGYSYVFRYRANGTTTWTETAPVSDQVNGSVGTIFTGLTNGTSYEWQVKTVCSPGNESAYSASTYSSTFCQPANLGSYNSILVFNNSVTFNWGNFGIPLNANLRWRVVGTTTWNTANNIANDTYSATGLTPGTNYEAQIQTICADGSLSPFSTSRTFTTGNCTPPQSPTVSSATINSGQTATLTASGCSGTVNWYSAASGGTSLGAGTSFTTPALTATTIYYASCTMSNCVSTSRGTGTVTVTGSTTCPVPTGMQWSNTTATSFQPYCNNTIGYSYVFHYRVSGTITWTETAPVSTNLGGAIVTTFTGLMNGTTYEWQVKTVCSPGNESAYSASTFSSTFCQPAALNNSNAIVVNGNSVAFSWSNFGIPLSANVRWRAVGAATWNTVSNITNDTYTVTGLTLGTSYEVQIQTICADGSLSPFSASKTFATAGCTPPQPPSISPATINSGQTATLTASGCSGTVNWYSAANGGTSLSAGTSFTTSALTTNTTYYASCTVNNCVSTTRGSGTVTINGNANGLVFSIKSGSWHDPSTWDCNCVPNKDQDVEIKSGHTVTVSAGDANLKNLKYSGGNLTFQGTRKLCFGCSSSDLTAGLVAYYPFNGNANDASGNGNNGAPYGGATLTNDRKGGANGAYNFGGFSNSSFIEIPVSTSLQFTNSFSVSLWYSMNTYAGMDGYGQNVSQGYHMLFAKEADWGGFYAGTSGNVSQDSVYYNLTNKPNYSTTNFNASASFKGTTASLNTWICMTYVVESSQIKIFRNGVLIKNQPITNSPSFTTANARKMYLGRYSQTWYPLNGKLDDVRVYNRALSDAEVTEIYNLEK